MNLSVRFRRRLAAGVGLAGAAILLPTAALASSAAGGSADHLSSPAAACVAAHTRVWIGLPADHAAGHAYYQLQISNVGHSTCTFFGYPGVSQLNSAGHQVGHPATHYGNRISVTLAPGATSHVVLVVVNAGGICTNPVPSPQLKVFPPGQFFSQNVPLTTQACPGHSVLQVDSVHPRAGIPFYSIR